ncbi:hypothetical protein HYU91_00140 [Candidatus Collierbacteria bacterium]|nr:hypothetical protein [Candidatus Collierbacteria bacterium]
MRTKISFLLVVVIGALLAAACSSSNSIVHQADPTTKELVIKTWAAEGNRAELTVSTVDGDFSASASYFTWYYDVPADQVEYLVEIRPASYMDLHLHEGKAPQK